MHERRKKQIVDAVAKDFSKNGGGCLNVSVIPEDVFDAAEALASAISLNILIQAGRKGEISYIGRRKICLALKKEFGGRVKRIDYCWVWQGNAYTQSVKDAVVKMIMEAK